MRNEILSEIVFQKFRFAEILRKQCLNNGTYLYLYITTYNEQQYNRIVSYSCIEIIRIYQWRI